MGGKMEKFKDIIKQFKNKKILVIGDVMLDKYIWGEVSRISPEAPVQVVNVNKESYAPGGAANVASILILQCAVHQIFFLLFCPSLILISHKH